MAMKGIKWPMGVLPTNTSTSEKGGFAIADALHIGGHRVVASREDLYTLNDWQLLNPSEEEDTDLAVGQQWWVKGDGAYRLTSWADRKSASGWMKVVDPNAIDITLFEIVTALPTSNIKNNRIYLMKQSSVSSAAASDKNIYIEYIYTGDPTQAYDGTKWEKLGEYKADIDLSGYATLTNGKVSESQLWEATTHKAGLMSSSGKQSIDAIAGIGIATSAKAGYVKSAVVTTPGKGEVAAPVNVVVKADGTMYADLRAASSTKLGVIGTAAEKDDSSLPLQVDMDGNGYVEVGTLSNADIDKIFTAEETK